MRIKITNKLRHLNRLSQIARPCKELRRQQTQWKAKFPLHQTIIKQIKQISPAISFKGLARLVKSTTRMKTWSLSKPRLTRYLELYQMSKIRKRAKSVQRKCHQLII